MELKHVAALLGIMATFDYRETDETDDQAWHAVIGDLGFDDAKAAVIEHYKTSGDRMKPMDVRSKVKALRAERARLNGAPVGAGGSVEIPDADPDDCHAYLAAVREQRMRFGGHVSPRPVGALLSSRPFRTVAPVTAVEMSRELRALPATSIGDDR